MDDDFSDAREKMVREQIEARGIADSAVRRAMRCVPREAFVGAAWRAQAYDDSPLPIDDGQTISQPYIVALMLAAASIGPEDRMLEIGAGSGYASALAGCLARRVDAVERHPGLAASAAARLDRLGFRNVAVHCADGSGGWPAGAPYDAILVSASGPLVPEALRTQLAIGGRLVMPVGGRGQTQRLMKLTRRSDAEYDEEQLAAVVFVPLVGEHGWTP